MSIDVFYNVYGYTCFYKYLSKRVDEIKVEELTITIVSFYYHRELMKHLKQVRDYEIIEQDDAIYYVIGDIIPIQILVTKQLSEDKNLWLRSLTNDMKEESLVKKILEKYTKNRNKVLYRSVVNMIFDANKSIVEEDKTMLEIFEEILKDDIEKRETRINQLTIKMVKDGRTDELAHLFGRLRKRE